MKKAKLYELIRELLILEADPSTDDAPADEAEDVEKKPTRQYRELPDGSLDAVVDALLVKAEAGEDEDGKTAPQPFDVTKFSGEVARIVENFDSLVDISAIVVRRALNYVGTHSGADAADQLEEILETRYGISQERADEPQPPRAERAGPAMAG